MADNALLESGELLRIALPLMAKYKIPVTPTNYAVWYTYVANANEGVHEVIDEWIAGDVVITETMLRELHRDEISECNSERMERARQALRDLMSDVQVMLGDANGDVAKSDDRLSGYARQLEQKSLPLAKIRDIAGSLHEETLDIRSTGGRLREALHSSEKEVEELRNKLIQAKAQATTDALTGLANRGEFDRVLAESVAASDAGGPIFSLVIMDIDKFKRVNDTFGHLLGDKVIRYVSRIMTKRTKGADLAARYGGEEFALILPGTEMKNAQAVAADIRRTVEAGRLVRGKGREPIGTVTISGGIAQHCPGESAADLIERADKALYESKHEGRNRITLAA